MANINTSVTQLVPTAGASNDGTRMGILSSTVKAAQNDTVTITNAREIFDADIRIDATGAAEPYTISSNVITLTSITTGSVRAIIYYRQ